MGHKTRNISHTFDMANSRCDFQEKFGLDREVFECGTCGNHVCKECAEKWSRVCPHCFGRLYRIS